MESKLNDQTKGSKTAACHGTQLKNFANNAQQIYLLVLIFLSFACFFAGLIQALHPLIADLEKVDSQEMAK